MSEREQILRSLIALRDSAETDAFYRHVADREHWLGVVAGLNSAIDVVLGQRGLPAKEASNG